MLVLKTISLINGINTILSSIIILIFILIALAIIVFAIYIKIKDINFRKNAIPVKLKVKEVKENKDLDDNNNEIKNGYITTFEFTLYGNKKEETLTTTKKFKVGAIKNGLYLKNDKSNTLSVEGEGFYVAKGATALLISIGMIILFLMSYIIFKFPVRTLLNVIVTYCILLLGTLYFFPILFSQNKQDKIKKIYYDNANDDEYSTVNKSLVRYIPTTQFRTKNKKSNNKPPVGNIIFLAIFTILGVILSIVGAISTYGAIKVKLTYSTTIGKIEEIYKYTKESNNETIELTGIIYKYTINGKEYMIDEKTGSSYELNSSKIGDKEKIYYKKENPDDAVSKDSLKTTVVPLIIGLMFTYVGLHSYIADRKKEKLYKKYVLKETK